jgi:uncharacterized HAD superfamily protein
MKEKLKIGVDVDGVIFDYMVTVRASAEMYDFVDLNKSGVINREAMKVGQRYDWTKEELKTFADKYFVELSKTTPFNPLAVEVLKKLMSEGHEIYIISNRGILHEDAITVVEKRFKENDLAFTNTFWKVSEKLDILLSNNIDVMIDDSPEVCEDAIKNGIYALYFREKNSKLLPKNPKLFEVDNWGEIYRYINQINNNN